MVGSSRDDPTSTAAARVDLQRALAALGPANGAQRELAHLIFVEDRALADVAAYLDIPEGTVKSRVFKVSPSSASTPHLAWSRRCSRRARRGSRSAGWRR